MSKRDRQHEGNLQYYCENRLFLKSRIALLTVYNQQSSKWTEKGLLLFEYTQLISQSLLIYSSLIQDPSQSLFEESIIYFFKMINPCYLLDFDGFSSLTWKMIIFMLVFTGLKWILAVYVVCMAHWDFQGPKLFLRIWRWVFKFQTRLICYLTTSFWVNTITNISNPGFQPENINKIFIIVVFGVLIVLEYLASFFIEAQFCDVLPRKNYLSAKNNEMQLITLAQKFFIQIIQLFFHNHGLSTFWLYSIFNLLLSSLRIQRLYSQLPMYQKDALFMLANLATTALALNIASLIGVIVKTSDTIHVPPRFVIILWVFTAVFGTQIIKSLLTQVTLALLSSHKELNSALLLSKIVFSKRLEKIERFPGNLDCDYHSTHLLKMSEIADFLKKSPHPPCSHEEYLLDLLVQNQKEPIIKLYLAKVWLKNLGICSKAFVFIKELLKKPWSIEYISALFLLQTIQQTYLTNAKQQEKFDFVDFVENQRLLGDLKDEMIKQADLKINICQNILSTNSNIGEIFNNSQLIHLSKRKIKRKMDIFFTRAPEFWSVPLLICSKYYLIMEHSSMNCQKYQDLYNQRNIKYDKYFSNSSLNRENIYQEDNAFFIIGGQKSENGLIKYCSRSVETLFGGEKPNYISKHISTLFLPSMQPVYKEFFQRVLDEGNTTLSQKVHQTFLYNKNGYMIEANFCLWLHPYITENPYLDLVIRAVKSSNEYLILKENGDIEGATKKACRIFGINFQPSHSSINIKTFSEELSNANQAFNLISKFELQAPVDPKEYSRALEIFNTFSNGKEVTIQTGSEDEIPTFCKILKISSKLPFLKLVVLSKPTGVEKFFHQEEETFLESPKRMATIFDEIPYTSRETDSDANFLFNFQTTEQPIPTLPPLTTERKLIPKSNLSEFTGPIAKDRQQNDELHDYISQMSASLKISEEKRAYKALKTALVRKAHSNFFRFLCSSFYLVVVFILASQILLKNIFDSTMQDLIIKKDLLNNAQLRSYYACKIPFTIPASYLLTLGIDVYAYLTGVSHSPAAVLVLSTGYYDHLATANRNIVQLLGNLADSDLLDELFKRDVRVFGSIYDKNDESFINLTSFKAVEQLDTALSYLNFVPDPIAPSLYPAYRYLQVNILDDFITKNSQITSAFQGSVDDQRDYLNFFISLCLVITPLLLAGVAFFLSFIIWSQYNKEKSYLSAFIKLHPTSIHSILENVHGFKQALLSDKSFEEKKLVQFFWNQFVSLEHLRISNHHSKHETQEMNCKLTKKKHLAYVIQMALYITVLIGILLWNFLSSRHSLDQIYHKQSQLQLSNEVSESVTVNMMGMVEMFLSNNTGNVSGVPALNYTIASVSNIQHVITKVLNGFSELDGTYNDLIKTSVFDGEDCSLYTSFNYNYCVFLKNNGYGTNILSLLTSFEGILTYHLAVFENMSNRSLLNLAIEAYRKATSNTAVTSFCAFEAQRLNGIIDTQLSKIIDDSNKKQSVFLVVFIATMVAVSLLIWIQILSKLKELDNNFKRVLQVLPPKLVLSSFLLKQFLNKLSIHIFEV